MGVKYIYIYIYHLSKAEYKTLRNTSNLKDCLVKKLKPGTLKTLYTIDNENVEDCFKVVMPSVLVVSIII